MGLTIYLESERGEAVANVDDPQNLLHNLLPAHNDESFHCLRFIDWYQDTTFNQPQVKRVREELARIRDKARTKEETQLLDQIDELARRCEAQAHLYLKFRGD